METFGTHRDPCAPAPHDMLMRSRSAATAARPDLRPTLPASCRLANASAARECSAASGSRPSSGNTPKPSSSDRDRARRLRTHLPLHPQPPRSNLLPAQPVEARVLLVQRRFYDAIAPLLADAQALEPRARLRRRRHAFRDRRLRACPGRRPRRDPGTGWSTPIRTSSASSRHDRQAERHRPHASGWASVFAEMELAMPPRTAEGSLSGGRTRGACRRPADRRHARRRRVDRHDAGVRPTGVPGSRRTRALHTTCSSRP